jgi:hypothetical protein
MERRGFGEQEVEYGYYRREEDFANELVHAGNRWRHERAVNVDQLIAHLRRERFDAIVLLGSSPPLLVRKAVFYSAYPLGPKTVLLEFEKRAWESTDPFSIWNYLKSKGQLHLLNNFVHLVNRKAQRKFLPVAYDRKIDWNLEIADVATRKLTAAHVEQLFSDQIEEGQRLDYKRAATFDDRKDLDKLIDRICGMANAQGGSIVVGVVEANGLPVLPFSKSLEHVAKPDRAIMRVEQKLFGRLENNRPDVQFRTLSVKGRNIVVMQIAEGISKQYGAKRFDDGVKVPVRQGRLLSWVTLKLDSEDSSGV